MNFLLFRAPYSMFFLGDLAGTKLQSFVLGAPYQDGIKTSPFAVFSQDATVFLLVFGCATSKNP